MHSNLNVAVNVFNHGYREFNLEKKKKKKYGRFIDQVIPVGFYYYYSYLLFFFFGFSVISGMNHCQLLFSKHNIIWFALCIRQFVGLGYGFLYLIIDHPKVYHLKDVVVTLAISYEALTLLLVALMYKRFSGKVRNKF